jgi:hypothetical protein
VIKGIQTMDTSSEIRQRWLDEERSVRSRMAEVGVVLPDQLKSFGGLEWRELLGAIVGKVLGEHTNLLDAMFLAALVDSGRLYTS